MTLENSAYTRRQWRRAVNLSAILGWASIALPVVYQSNIAMLPWTAIIGLPVAFAASWTMVAPFLAIIMRRPISWTSAAIWGGGISASISALFITITRLQGYFRSINPNVHSQLGGGAYIREIDGILTPYGWQVLGQYTLMFIGMGVVAALLVRAIIGDGQAES